MGSFLDVFKSKPPAKVAATSIAGRASYSVDDLYTNPTAQNQALWQLYCSNPWVARCVDSIAGALSKGFVIKAIDEKQDIEPSQIEDFLNHPNETDNFETLINRISRSLLIFGVAFIEVQRVGLTAEQVRPVINKALSAFAGVIPNFDLEVEDTVQLAMANGIPRYMRVIPTWQVEVQSDKKGNITGYKQRTQDGQQIDFAPNEVLHIVHPMSFDPKYGNSPLEAVSTTAVVDNLIRLRQKNVLKNISGVADIYRLKDASKEDVQRFQEELMRSYRGANAAGNFLVTSSDVEHESLSQTAEGEYLKLREMNKEEIAMKLGVPLTVLGENDGNSLSGSGQSGAHRTFIENTVRPLARHIEGIFNIQIIEPFESVGVPNCAMELALDDTTDNQALETMWDTMLKNGSSTVNEVRTLRGVDPYPDMGDEPYIDAKEVFAVKDVGVPVPPPAPPVLPLPPDVQAAKAQAVTELRQMARELRKKLG